MVKKLIFPILIAVFASSQLFALTEKSSEKPRIALVLSGGIVTRGLAEIGVIKALEEENIPISYVAGTSMGSVLGSLLAQGYTADEIKEIARSIDWMQAFLQTADYRNLLSGEKEKYGKYILRIELEGFKPVIPKSLVDEQKPALLFTEISIRSLNVTDFNKLKIPFRANATDLENGKEVVFSSGYLPKVLQASAAVPMMLAPVEIDGKLLVDGGAVNNLPVNLVKEFKPDIIVAVNLGAELRSKEELNSFLAILSQNLSFLQKESADRNRKLADILIEPDIAAYSFSDFSKIDEIVDVGYRAAKEKMPELKRLIALKGKKLPAARIKERETRVIESVYINGGTVYPKNVLPEIISSEAGKVFDPDLMESDRKAIWRKYFFDGYKLAEVHATFEAETGRLKFKIDEGNIEEIRFVGRENMSRVFLEDKISRIRIFNVRKVMEDIDRLYATGYFESVNYTIDSGQNGHVLAYTLKEKHHHSLALGIRYDTYQNLSLLADLTLNFARAQNFQQTVSLKIGNEYNYQYVAEFWPGRFGQNLLGEFGLFYSNKIQDIYTGGSLSSNFHYLTKGMRLSTKVNIEPLGRVSSGIEFNEVTYERIFSLLPTERIARLFLKTKLDFLDAPIFPSSGAAVRVEYTQGITALGGNYDFSKSRIDLEGYLPLPRRHVAFVKNKIYLGRGNVPFSERYRLGGADSLVGFGRDQFIGKDLLQLRLGYRLPLTIPSAGLLEGVYLSLIQDFGVVASSFDDLKKNEMNAGYGAELQFNTLLGLAARLNLGYGQGFNLFFSIGNEF